MHAVLYSFSPADNKAAGTKFFERSSSEGKINDTVEQPNQGLRPSWH